VSNSRAVGHIHALTAQLLWSSCKSAREGKITIFLMPTALLQTAWALQSTPALPRSYVLRYPP
jgi:hypothetical protein